MVCYGGADLLDLEPGQTVAAQVKFQDSARLREDTITNFTAQGVFLLAYQRGDEAVYGEGSAGSPRWWPAHAARAMQNRVTALFDGDEAAFLSAILTGDTSGLSEEARSDLSEAGLSHILAVSRVALRLSDDADSAAHRTAPAPSGGGAGAARPDVLYAVDRGQSLGGPGLHHGGVRAGGTPVSAGQRPAHHAVRRPVFDPAGEPLCGGLHQSAAVLRSHGGASLADAEAPGPAVGGETEWEGLPTAGFQPVGHRGGHGIHGAPCALSTSGRWY